MLFCTCCIIYLSSTRRTIVGDLEESRMKHYSPLFDIALVMTCIEVHIVS
jgi:hypothetical protein